MYLSLVLITDNFVYFVPGNKNALVVVPFVKFIESIGSLPSTHMLWREVFMTVSLKACQK